MVFQIFLIAFAVFAASRTWVQYRRCKVSKQWAVVWTLLWIAVIVVALVPKKTDAIALALGVERGADLLVYVAIVLLSYAVFRGMVLTQKLHEEHTELVRRIALAGAQEPVETSADNAASHAS